MCIGSFLDVDKINKNYAKINMLVVKNFKKSNFWAEFAIIARKKAII